MKEEEEEEKEKGKDGEGEREEGRCRQSWNPQEVCQMYVCNIRLPSTGILPSTTKHYQHLTAP